MLALFLLACNNSSEKKPVNTDTVTAINQMPDISTIPDTIFTGFGMEPFWSAYVIGRKKLFFIPPMVLTRYFLLYRQLLNPIQQSIAMQTSGNTIEMTIVRKDCIDGMSEITHGYTVSLSIDNKKYKGCGRDGK